MAEFFKDNENLEEEDNDIIILHNEVNDTDEEFYHLATLDVDKRWFIIMKPVEKLEDIADDEVLIYEIVEKDGEDKCVLTSQISGDEDVIIAPSVAPPTDCFPFH